MKNTEALSQQMLQIFQQKFNRVPALYFSPGRINLIGEHTDYNDGYVMPAAIDKGVYYAIAENGTGNVNFYAADLDEYFSVPVDEIKKEESWKNYVLSVVNEFLLLNKKIRGFDCVFGGDIPRGSGMSSSAAVEGGLAFALNEMFEYGLQRDQLALLCQRAEHNFPGVNCGIMDQFANMLGKKDNVILLDCQSLSHEYFPLQLDGYKIVLVNSKVHHSLAAGEYNIRRKQCEEGLMIIAQDSALRSFRDIAKWEDLLAYEGRMGEEVYMRCLYVVQEIDRTKKAAALLQQNDLEVFGKLMFETHDGLSKLYGVSCKELDFLAEYARSQPAVIGARLMGGGFGGCTINIVKENEAAAFAAAISKEYEQKFDIIPEIYFVQTADGCKKL